MSIIAILVFATDQDIDALIKTPERIEQFIEEERTSTDLDKAWHGIHWLLTGTADAGSEPLCYLLSGGEQIGNIDVGYGPARAISAAQVKSWDKALMAVKDKELSLRFDPKAMLKAKIYPDIWARSLKDEEDTLAYLMGYLTALRQFVASAVKEESGLVIYLS